MRKFSIAFFAFLVLLFAGMIGYVALSKDFTEPSSGLSQEEYGITEDSPIWNLTIDDLAQYLYDKGMLKTLDYLPLSGGIATEARQYGDLDLYWWDVENLEEGSAEQKAYEEMSESGMIDLWGTGSMMSLTRQGPFGLWTTNYTGDLNELLDAYHAFGTEK